MIVSLEVDGLFTNIPHSEGISAMEEALNDRVSPTVPTSLIEN